MIYCRVSSKEQAEGYSLDAQLSYLRDYAARQGLEVLREFVEAETAKAAGRRLFGEMVKLIAKDPSIVILVEKSDRLTRNLRDAVAIDDVGATFHAVKEGMIIGPNSRSHDRLMHGIKVVLARHYIDNLAEEARKGMWEKAKQGFWPTHAPVGYKNALEAGRRIIVPDMAMATPIRKTFEAYATGEISLHNLCSYAYALGLRNTKGGKVLTQSINLLLRNPIYTGIVRWNGEEYEGSHDPIISQALYDRTQEALSARAAKTTAGTSPKPFAYKGLLTCARCGCTITAETKQSRYVYYRCSGAREVEGRRCDKRGVREEAITEMVAQHLKGLTIRPEVLELLKTALKDSQAGQEETKAEEREVLQREEARLTKLLKRAYLDLVEGVITTATYNEIKADWEADLKAITKQQSQLPTADIAYYDLGAQILEAAANCYEEFKAASPEHQRDMLASMAEKAILREGKLELTLKPWFALIMETNQETQMFAGSTDAERVCWLSKLAELRRLLAAA